MIGTITASRLNVRTRPHIDGRKIGELPKGTVVDLLGEKSGWFELRYREVPAFVFGDYVKLHDRPPRQTAVITAGLLNVRDRPSTNGMILGTLAEGAVVPVLDPDADWMEIPFHEGTAFISRHYAALYEAGEIKRGRVTAALLNVRDKPRLGAPILGQLPKDTSIAIEAELGDWYEIAFNNGRGYVSNRYIRLAAPREDPSETPAAGETEENEEAGVASGQPVEEAPLAPPFRLTVAGTSEERSAAAAWNRFGGLLERLSREKEIETACAVAVLCVESSGKGFEPANQHRMIIRFENHKFWRYWGKNDPGRFRQHFTYRSDKVWKGHQWRKSPETAWQSFHGSQRAEWEVLGFARAIDNAAALMSISMGAPQIMGFNYQRIGYQSAQEMFDAFCQGVEVHINGMFDFMSPAMLQQLRQGEFTGFAGLYNGSGQKEAYGSRIRRHYQAFRRIA